jgi:hypothetical protein
VNLFRGTAANDARANQELVVARAASKRGKARDLRRFRAVVGEDESLEAAERWLVVLGDRAARIGSERGSLRFGNAFGHARERRHQRALVDILDQVRVDRPDDPVKHRPGAHPAAGHA